MTQQDIIVIGASAGGIVALRALVHAFPPTLQASLFVVVHTTPDSPGLLADVLNSAGPLPASKARPNEQFVPGHIYVAPPNYHLLVTQDRLRVEQGPLEHHVRPAIDVLFRSAALAYGPRVTGILLSGLMDDGVAGLGIIKASGGRTIVQAPDEAQFSELPVNALRQGKVDFCLPVTKIAELLAEPDHGQPAAMQADPGVANGCQQAAIENRTAAPQAADEARLAAIGEPFAGACPVCQAALWQIREEAPPRFRCRNGHAFTLHTLELAQEARQHHLQMPGP